MKLTAWFYGSFVVLAMHAPAAWAGDDGGGAHLEKVKLEASAEIDEHSNKLQEHKTCINGATTPQAVRQCREQMKQWRQGQRAEHMDRAKEKHQQHIQKIDAKKEKMTQDRGSH